MKRLALLLSAILVVASGSSVRAHTMDGKAF